MQMQIGIDARMYGSTQSGLGRYIEQLVQNLAKIDIDNNYIIFLSNKNYDLCNIDKPNFQKVLINIPWYSASEQIVLPIILKKYKLDLMHFPHWNVPLLYNKPFVVTIHDLIMYHYSRAEASTRGPIMYWIKDRLHRLILRSAAQRAKKIITPSVFSQNDIAKTLKIDKTKIEVTALAPISNVATHAIEIKNLGITKPFVLYVGNAYPHKNLSKLIKAYQNFTKQSHEYQLVLVGKKNYFYNKLSKKFDLGKNSDIILTDYVDDATLSSLYANAKLYISPSLYEGFGLPPLEAMQHGVPVISSRASCMPEILDDAVLYFNPQREEEIVRLIKITLNDKNLRSKLIERGKNLLKQYSWQKTALKTLQIYKK